MTKHLLTTITAIFAMFIIAACGGTSSDSSSTGSTGGTVPTTPTSGALYAGSMDNTTTTLDATNLPAVIDDSELTGDAVEDSFLDIEDIFEYLIDESIMAPSMLTINQTVFGADVAPAGTGTGSVNINLEETGDDDNGGTEFFTGTLAFSTFSTDNVTTIDGTVTMTEEETGEITEDGFGDPLDGTETEKYNVTFDNLSYDDGVNDIVIAGGMYERETETWDNGTQTDESFETSINIDMQGTQTIRIILDAASTAFDASCTGTTGYESCLTITVNGTIASTALGGAVQLSATDLVEAEETATGDDGFIDGTLTITNGSQWFFIVYDDSAPDSATVWLSADDTLETGSDTNLGADSVSLF